MQQAELIQALRHLVGQSDVPTAKLDITRVTPSETGGMDLAFVLSLPDGGISPLIGRIYPQRGEAMARKYQLIWQNLSKSHLTIPKPIGYLEKHRLFLRQRFPGVSLVSMALEGDPQLEMGIYQAGRWLAQFHGIRHLALPAQDLVEERMAHLGRQMGVLDLFAAHNPHSRYLVQALQERFREQPEGQMTTIHGKFLWEQLFWGSQGLAAVEMDRVVYGDPASDLGAFLAEIEVWSMLSPDVFRRERLFDQFWRGYTLDVDLQQIRTWRAFALLERSQAMTANHPGLPVHLMAQAHRLIISQDGPALK